MTQQLEIMLDEDIYEFVISHSGKNPDAFINKILSDYKKRQFEREIFLQMAEDDNSPQLKQELKNWHEF